MIFITEKYVNQDILMMTAKFQKLFLSFFSRNNFKEETLTGRNFCKLEKSKIFGINFSKIENFCGH